MLLAASLFVLIAGAPGIASSKTVSQFDIALFADDPTHVGVVETWIVTFDQNERHSSLEKVFYLSEGDSTKFEFIAATLNGEPLQWTRQPSYTDATVRILLRMPDQVEKGTNRQEYVFRYWLNIPVGRKFTWYISEDRGDFVFDGTTVATVSLTGPAGQHVDISDHLLDEYEATNGGPVAVEQSTAGESQRAVIGPIANLKADAGIFIFARFEPGFVGAGTGPEHLYRQFFPIGGLFLPVIVLLTIVYYIAAIAWSYHRSRRPSIAAVGRLSPAATRFFSVGRFDSVALAAALVDLIRQNFITIVPGPDDAPEMRRTPDRDPHDIEFEDERRLLDALFPSSIDVVPLSYKRSKHFKSVTENFETGLYRDFALMDLVNRRYVWAGGFAIIMILLFFDMARSEIQGHHLTTVIVAFNLILVQTWQIIRHRHMKFRISKLTGRQWFNLIGTLGFAGVFVVRLPETIKYFGYGIPLILALVIAFSIWLAATLTRPVRPAPQDARKIETMRSKLAALLKHKDRDGTAPVLTDDLIPYAMALDMDGRWSNRYAERVQQLLGRDPNSLLIPWYQNEDVGLVAFGQLAQVAASGQATS